MGKRLKRTLSIVFAFSTISMIGLLGSVYFAPKNAPLIISFAVVFIISVSIEMVIGIKLLIDYAKKNYDKKI